MSSSEALLGFEQGRRAIQPAASRRARAYEGLTVSVRVGAALRADDDDGASPTQHSLTQTHSLTDSQSLTITHNHSLTDGLID